MGSASERILSIEDFVEKSSARPFPACFIRSRQKHDCLGGTEQSRHGIPHTSKPKGPSRTPMAPFVLAKTRWPLRSERNDTNKAAHSIGLRNARRRSEGAANIKQSHDDHKSDMKKDARQHRRNRSNEMEMRCTNSDRDSARDSDTNLLIENMRNRECEMFNKISNNNGYYCCSSSENDDLIYFLRRRNSIATVSGLAHAHAKKRRSAGSNKAARNSLPTVGRAKKNDNDRSIIECQTKECETKRKVNFTIRISQICKKGDLESRPKLIVDNTEPNEFGDNSPSSFSDIEGHDLLSHYISDGNSLIEKSDNYFDCFEEANSLQSSTLSRASTSSSVYEDAMETPSDTMKSNRTRVLNTKNASIISIVQEITSDNVVNSSIQIGKDQLKTFKNNHAFKATDNPYHLEPIKNISNSSNRCAKTFEKRKTMLSEDEIESRSSLPDKKTLITHRLDSGPKYTGKSIGRLLAMRLEKNQSLQTSRKALLQSFARLKPPEKPPRSFTYSSQSSPSSKQSSDGIVSATTVPIGELFSNNVANRSTNEAFFLVSPALRNIYGEEDTQFGWINAIKETENNSMPRQQPFGWTLNSIRTAEQKDQENIGWARSAKLSGEHSTQMKQRRREETSPQHILNMLSYEQYQPSNAIQTTNSEPAQAALIGFHIPAEENIDTVDNSVLFDKFSNEMFPCSTPFGGTPIKGKGPINTKDRAEFPNPSSIPMNNDSKIGENKPETKMGNTAIQKTKTLLGASKRFLKKQVKSPKKWMKDPEKAKTHKDDTAHFNSESFNTGNCEKLTPKKIIDQVNLQESPTRDRPRSKQHYLQRDSVSAPDNDDTFHSTTKNTPPKTMISKLVKTPKKILRSISIKKHQSDPDFKARLPSPTDTNFYKSFNGNNDKVPLMGEILNQLRDRVESDLSRPPSARKTLFQNESSDALDDISNKIVEIDLHDTDPEPLIYAEVQPPQMEPSSSSKATQAVIRKPTGPPTDIREVYIDSDNKLDPPKRYIMVNNDPSALYATVKAKPGTSSSESLHINIVNDFAQSIENMWKRSESERKSEYIIRNPSIDVTTDLSDVDADAQSLKNDTSLLFHDNISLDTFDTENLYETITSGNLNDEIIQDIDILESSYAPFDAEISSIGAEDYEYVTAGDYSWVNATPEPNEGKTTHVLREINEPSIADNGFDTVDFETKGNTQTIEMNANVANSGMHKIYKRWSSPKKLPNYKHMKKKLRNSVRKSKSYLKEESRKLSELFENSPLSPRTRSQRKTPHTPNSRPKADVRQLLQSTFNQSHHLTDEFLQKMIAQLNQQIKLQVEIRNVLDVCRATKEFYNSCELIEAERLALISHLKEVSAMDELDRIYYDDMRFNNSDLNTGNVAIDSIQLSLLENDVPGTHFNYFYICTFTYRGEVHSTVVKEGHGNMVVFDNCKIRIKCLEPRFKLRAEVHGLKLKKSMHPAGQKDSLIPEKSKRRLWTQPLADGSHRRNAEKLCPTNVLKNTLRTNSDISRFKLLGSTVLSSVDLYSSQRQICRETDGAKSNKFIISMKESKAFDLVNENHDHLTSNIKIDFQSEVVFMASSLTGFLNIADCNSNWNRRWCSLEGFYMNFWNYPQDFNTMMPPISSIYLVNCICENSIGPADRQACAKPRSFILDILDDPNDRNGLSTIKRESRRFFISADTSSDLNTWLSEINRVIAFVRDWYINML